MTDDDVKMLDQEVGATPLDPQIEKEWAKAMLADMKNREQQAMARFKLYKFMRNDIQMEETVKELRDMRKCKDYLQSLIDVTVCK